MISKSKPCSYHPATSPHSIVNPVCQRVPSRVSLGQAPLTSEHRISSINQIEWPWILSILWSSLPQPIRWTLVRRRQINQVLLSLSSTFYSTKLAWIILMLLKLPEESMRLARIVTITKSNSLKQSVPRKKVRCSNRKLKIFSETKSC